ncbi:hypothetical protein K458DRAFT_382153 [Lentithecium fluviatile CBS 122367]|uniref:Protein kinase domain-containing protein n=1 Tax=Lentithecium fluviatile CBS 122367 TaxID=1168545 RepID=A0A6G1JK42_9PLEO|nr:hypothetical protein K458DRAFT_382153 [Lentithecium fluviatile CBS 122367]
MFVIPAFTGDLRKRRQKHDCIHAATITFHDPVLPRPASNSVSSVVLSEHGSCHVVNICAVSFVDFSHTSYITFSTILAYPSAIMFSLLSSGAHKENVEAVVVKAGDLHLDDDITTLPNFMMLASGLGIEGPRALQAFNLDTGHYEQIGEGAQFHVFKPASETFEEGGYNVGYVADEGVVVKRISRRLYETKTKDIATPSAAAWGRSERKTKDSLRDLRLEIQVLAQDIVRKHPNIIDLIAWGYDHPRSMCEERRDMADRYPLNVPIPVLFVQKALCPLDGFFDTGAFLGSEVSPWSIRYQLALGIAAGLECLRDILILHNDLKPENILVCRQNNPLVSFISKLADFGLSVTQVDDFRKYGRTYGWKPPEASDYDKDEHGQYSREALFKSESYAYGLVALYTICSREYMAHGFSFPQRCSKRNERKTKAMQLIKEQSDFSNGEKEQARVCYVRIESHFLKETPQARDYASPRFLRQAVPAYENWYDTLISNPKFLLTSVRVASFESLHTSESKHVPYKKMGRFHRGFRFFRNLKPRILEDLDATISDDFPADLLFGMAVGNVATRPDNYQSKVRRLINRVAVAKYPSVAAIGVISQINEAIPSPETPAPSSDLEQSVDFLHAAVASGSTVAVRLLQKLDPDRAGHAIDEFRANGGYNDEEQLIRENSMPESNTLYHWLTASDDWKANASSPFLDEMFKR